MKIVNVKLIASPDQCRLIINDNVKFEGEIVDYETLFRYIQNEAKGTVNINLHYEWTHDLSEWDRDHHDIVELSAGETEVVDIGIPVEEDEEECEHLHIEDSGWGSEVIECLDCGKIGHVEWHDE